jgi:penicillin-binding protein 1A
VQATVTSSNTVYAQLISDVGPSDAMAAAERYGVASPLHAYPSAVLGTNDVTGLDMATAYATFANRGLRVDPTFVTKVTRAMGRSSTSTSTPRPGCSTPASPTR